MNDLQIKAKLKAGKPGLFNIERGLYFRVSEQGTGFWVLRYTSNNSRHLFTIGRYGKEPEGISLANAKDETGILRAKIKKGFHPLAEQKRSSLINLKTANDVASDWLEDCKKRLKHPNIPLGVYNKDIRPFIGELAVEQVNARDILGIIRKINDSGRPTISNDALSYCKQIFNHAMKLDLISSNPAAAFENADAGGIEKERDRNLSLDEIKTVFETFRNNDDQFVRENYLACVLLLCLGSRKGELLGAPWDEFDLDNGLWHLPAARSKTGLPITYPLHSTIIECFNELKIRAFDSEFVFPNRRASKRFKHVSLDTLNAAVNKFFKEKKLKIKHFTIHDLRRTFRTLLAELDVHPHIAERCLNHKLPKSMAVYDKHDYLEQRKDAHNKIFEYLEPYIFPKPKIK